jgi:hypothetical protein
LIFILFNCLRHIKSSEPLSFSQSLLQFIWVIVILAGWFNLLLFLLTHVEISSMNRYLIVTCYLVPACLILFLYFSYRRVLSFIFIILGVFFVYLAFRIPVNYKIYAQKNPSDGSKPYMIAKCLDYYSKQGYTFYDGVATYNQSLGVANRNSIGSYLLSAAVIPAGNDSSELQWFRIRTLITNRFFDLNAPGAKNIRNYNYMVFSSGDNLPLTSIKSADVFYGKPSKILACVGNIKIAYYGTSKSRLNFNRVIYKQLTCQDPKLNLITESFYQSKIDKGLSSRLGTYLKRKFAINKEKEHLIATKVHYFADCDAVNDYLKSHPEYKKQVDALLN